MYKIFTPVKYTLPKSKLGLTICLEILAPRLHNFLLITHRQIFNRGKKMSRFLIIISNLVFHSICFAEHAQQVPTFKHVFYTSDQIQTVSSGMPEQFKRMEKENDDIFLTLKTYFSEIQKLSNEQKEKALDNYYATLQQLRELNSHQIVAEAEFKRSKTDIEKFSKTSSDLFELQSANEAFNRAEKALSNYTELRTQLVNNIKKLNEKYLPK